MMNYLVKGRTEEIMNINVGEKLVKDKENSLLAKEVKEVIEQIFEERKYVYELAPQDPKINIESSKERCEDPRCNHIHEFVKITAHLILREELLRICQHTKKNSLPLVFKDDTFYIVLS